MSRSDWGSLTKEPPLSTLDETIAGVRPGMPYDQLLSYARANTLAVAPGLIRKRFLLVDDDGTIIYDRFLQLASERGLSDPFVRKVMYFVWAYRDERLRRFICEQVANQRGKWRASQLLNKNNAKFFEEWFVTKSAIKARSNIEFFLVKAEIFNPADRSIHLNLDDGWLSEAAVVAAQHESNISDKLRLLNNPKEFLIEKGWVGLVNATAEELRKVDLPATDDPSPLEDDSIPPAPTTEDRSQSWNRDQPEYSGEKSTTTFVDLVAKERASKAHYMLEKLTADAARLLGYDPRYNKHIDLYFSTSHGTVLAEIKSAYGRNFHSQVRKGISQLFEYRFVYRDTVGEQPTLLLVIETRPPRLKTWLVDYLDSLKIILAWKDAETSRLVSSRPIPRTLEGIVHSLEE